MKRKANKLQEADSSRCLSSGGEWCNDDSEEIHEELETSMDFSVSVPMQFEQLTKELEVKVYTGLSLPKMFQFLFNYLSEKAQSIHLIHKWSPTWDERAAKHGIEAFWDKSLFSCKLWSIG